MEQLETAILADVVTQFASSWQSTSRFSILVKYEGHPAWQAIANLTSHNIVRKSDVNKPTDEEEYLPTAAAFELCGNAELLTKAKTATTVVLHTLKQMFKGERKKKEGFSFEDFQRHVNDIYPGNNFECSSSKLGLKRPAVITFPKSLPHTRNKMASLVRNRTGPGISRHPRPTDWGV